MADKGEEAGKLLKKANKLLAPSLLDMRLKPDWEAAAPLLDRAALLFKQAGNVEKALETYEKAAQAQDKIGSPWHAAKHMESAAEYSKQQKQYDKAMEYFKSAAEYYITAGKATIGADCLSKGARAIEEWDTEAAMTLLFDALDIYENEDREANAQDVYRLATGIAVKAKRWMDAVDVQMRFATYCERTRAISSQCKCYLGVVVTYLYAKEAKQAWLAFQDALAVDAFVSSEEAFAADALFNAYRTGDEEMVRKVVQQKSCFKQLDNQVARLAVKLPQGRMDKMARRLARVMGDGEEEDGEVEGEGERDEIAARHNEDEELL